MIPIYHDFFLLDKGRLVDRNSGVEVVKSLNELAQLCGKNRRVWVMSIARNSASKGRKSVGVYLVPASSYS